MLIRIDKIISDPGQPRKTFKEETLEELKESVDSLGLINPLTVKPTGDGKHMIIVGERRFRAAKKAGLSEVECIVRTDVDDKKAREMQFAENYHLEPLISEEQSLAWVGHLNAYKMSQREFAQRVGVDETVVSAAVKTVRDLSPKLKPLWKSGDLSTDLATRIARVGDTNFQEKLARPILEGKVGGRKATEFVEKAKAEPTRPVEDVVDEVVYGVKHVPKEELGLAKAPETMLDIGFKLQEKALDLSQMLTAYDLSRIPAGQRLALTSALRMLADKIELALEFLTGKKRREIEGVIEGEASQ